MIFTITAKEQPGILTINKQHQVTVAIGPDEGSVIGQLATANNLSVDIAHIASVDMELINKVITQHEVNKKKALPIIPEKIELPEPPKLNMVYSPERSFTNMVKMILEDDNSKELRQKLTKLELQTLTNITKKLCNSV